MTYGDQLRNIANQYFGTHKVRPTAHEVAQWAIDEGLWRPQPADLVKHCADQIARAMRED